ncbi:hypothetical protein [Sansalvadorimonas verongulae]|uniref:hypothetical protein n=1 Tax=Sansalvadorimonas verongulae TaxID=2172824 RepID=UPI0012BC64C8|nr:hypothetical protein [Sansalvadorimonas verongulae]MTI14213.1 hypothetical protein [Sansalvadorimonas verongulae]
MPERISQNQLALERLRAEARRRAEEVSEQSAEAIEKQQQKNVISAGFGGENTVSYLTGDGDIVGATGQVTPVLDRPEAQPVGKTQVSEFEDIAAHSRQDVAAGKLLLVGDELGRQGYFSPELQAKLGNYAMQLALAEDVPKDALERITSGTATLEQVIAGTADQSEVGQVLAALSPLLSHKADEISQGADIVVQQQKDALAETIRIPRNI